MTDKGIRIVDPPHGYLYGFPAPLQENYEEQLRKAKYPERDISMALAHSRYWTQKVTEQ